MNIKLPQAVKYIINEKQRRCTQTKKTNDLMTRSIKLSELTDAQVLTIVRYPDAHTIKGEPRPGRVYAFGSGTFERFIQQDMLLAMLEGSGIERNETAPDIVVVNVDRANQPVQHRHQVEEDAPPQHPPSQTQVSAPETVPTALKEEQRDETVVPILPFGSELAPTNEDAIVNDMPDVTTPRVGATTITKAETTLAATDSWGSEDEDDESDSMSDDDNETQTVKAKAGTMPWAR